MKNYKVIEGCDLEELTEEVNSKIKNGFIPIGGAFFDSNDYYYKQTMFKPYLKISREEV